jgi:hypothetical protein
VVLQKGAIAKLGETTYVDDEDGTTPTFKMATGTVIEISTHSWKISGGNVGLELDATIIAADTLNIASSATLTIKATKKLTLKADGAEKGAKITGAGAVKADVTLISGGTSGWQAIGTGVIDIGSSATNASEITADLATSSLTALGPGATITQVGGATNDLTITATAGPSTTGVINLSTGGAIILSVNATAAKLSLPANCLIKIGGGEATGSVTNVNLKTALKDGTTAIAVATGLTGKASIVGAGVLTQIIGVAPTNHTITGPASGTDNLVITANMAATGTS